MAKFMIVFHPRGGQPYPVKVNSDGDFVRGTIYENASHATDLTEEQEFQLERMIKDTHYVLEEVKPKQMRDVSLYDLVTGRI